MLYSNILLIDDDEDDQEIFVTALNELDSSVVCQAEHSALEALQKLEKKSVGRRRHLPGPQYAAYEWPSIFDSGKEKRIAKRHPGYHPDNFFQFGNHQGDKSIGRHRLYYKAQQFLRTKRNIAIHYILAVCHSHA